MNQRNLIVRGFFQRIGLGQHKAYMELWTCHMSDEVMWGGMRYSYDYYRSGNIRHNMTAYPQMQPQGECAQLSTAAWKYPTWKQRKLVVVAYNPGIKESSVGYDIPLGNAWLLQHLARIDGILSEVFGGEKAILAQTLRRRLDGLMMEGNNRLADATRPLM